MMYVDLEFEVCSFMMGTERFVSFALVIMSVKYS